METTKVSVRGQVVIPKSLRQKYRWETGQELEVIDTNDGLLLKAGQAASWDDVAGCLRHLAQGRPAPTDGQMRAAVHRMAARRYRFDRQLVKAAAGKTACAVKSP